MSQDTKLTLQSPTSFFCSRNVREDDKLLLTSISRFTRTDDINHYLKIPIDTWKNFKSSYFYLIDQVNSTLANQKTNYLSFIGHITLAKLVISSVPTYTTLVAKILGFICYEIKKLQRGFIWGHEDGTRRMHLVNQKRICSPKWRGGLGLHNVSNMNKVCIVKFTWKFMTRKDALQSRVLRVKYNSYDISKTKVLSNKVTRDSGNISMIIMRLQIRDAPEA